MSSDSWASAPALMRAAALGNEAEAKAILARGEPVDATFEGETALVWAAHHHKLDVARILVAHGADPWARRVGAGSALTLVANQGDAELVASMLARAAGRELDRTVLYYPAVFGFVDIVRQLIAAGAPVDVRDRQPLIGAAGAGRGEVVALLLAAGADHGARSHDGQTALHAAACAGYTQVVTQLLDAGLGIDEKDSDGLTSLMAACAAGATNTARLLVERGASLDDTSLARGYTALTLARQAEAPVAELIALLEARGAGVRPYAQPAPGEYLFITACGVCAYLPQRQKLDNSDAPMPTPGLEVVHEVVTSPGRDTVDTRQLKRCSLCGTFYQHDHWIDREDAWVSPVSVTHTIVRLDLFRVDDVLRAAGKLDALADHQRRRPAILAHFAQAIDGALAGSVRVHVVESILDDVALRGDWAALTRLLERADEDLVKVVVWDVLQLLGAFRSLFDHAMTTRPIARDAVAAWRADNPGALEAALDAIAACDPAEAAALRQAAERAKIV